MSESEAALEERMEEAIRHAQDIAIEQARNPGLVLLPKGEQMETNSSWVTNTLLTTNGASQGRWAPLKLKGPPITVLIDGDLIAYRCAAATNGTFYRVKKESTKYYKDALKIALKYEKDVLRAKALITKDKNPEPVSHAIHNLSKIIESTKKSIALRYGRPMEVEIFLTSDSLFRDDITPLYKKSREGLERPVNLAKCKEYLEKSHGAQTIPGYEADDLMAMYATELGPTDCIIVSLDKDLRQIPGEHYDFAKDRYETIDNHMARQNFWTQTLVGDSTDDIPGLKGVGPVTAKKILSTLGPEDEDPAYYKVVLETWIDRTPRLDDESDGDFYTRVIKLLSKSCRLLWLCREPEAIWQPPVASVSGDSTETV